MKLAINHQVHQVPGTETPADLTLLQYLRQQGLTGTKEGCASGDCGACTVMVGELKDDTVRFQSVNACIAPLGQFEGKHIITVEGLASDGLHVAQQQMIDCHGSQCGFCTPGFVMSLATLVENEADTDRDTVLQGISGNLCRCTGYRPIVEAGLNALEAGSPDSRLHDPGILGALQDDPGQSLIYRPESEKALQQLLADGGRLVAGGTDLMLEVTQLFNSIPRLIDVSQVETLRDVSESSGALHIGAAVSYSELEAMDVSPELTRLLHRLGSRQVRNRGTVGGNLANGSPIADMPPILIAWDAMLALVDSSGREREVAVEAFYTGYRQTVLGVDEYIARITIPKSSIDDFHRFYKSSKRIEDDISSVMGAFRFSGSAGEVTAARVAFGGMAATPVRLQEIEGMLAGRPIDDALIHAACERLGDLMTPMTDVRASADYRMAMAQAMLRRALLAFCGNEMPTVMELSLDA